MATEVLMPQLGESVTEGTIARWLVKSGDYVKKYEPLCEVTTDKVNAEVPSTVEGKVAQLVAEEGDTLAVGALICYIETVGDAPVPEAKPQSASVSPAAQTASAPSAPQQAVGAPVANKVSGKRYSPAVMRLAQEHGIDLNQVNGTGNEGRITRKDVLAFIENGGASAAPGAVAASPQIAARTAEEEMPSAPTTAISVPAAAPVLAPPIIQPSALAASRPQTVSVPSYPGDTQISVTPVRRAIANRMTQSKHEAPHAWTMVEVDMTNLVKLRNRMKEEFKAKEGFNLTFLPFFIKAVVESIKEYPVMNSVWAGDHIVLRKNINISIAVATDDALYVPVIKDADQKSIYGIARAVDELAAKTRAGKLTPDDMAGGTFTVNNTGSFGSVLSAPIINYPQAAIVSMESIVKRPVVIDDMIAIRDMANLCLSLDHRVLDGLVCGRFLQSVKQRLEAYGPETSVY